MPPNPTLPTSTPTIKPRYTALEAAVTVFTPPAECSTALPVLFGGTCSSGSEGIECQTWSPDQITSQWLSGYVAIFNYVYYTTSSSYGGATSCFPTDYLDIATAVSCPSGFTTASSWSDYAYAGNSYTPTTTAICCPPAYSKLFTEGEYSELICYKTLTAPGQTFQVAAWGEITSYSGYETSYWGTLSQISTTVINNLPTGTQFPLTIIASPVSVKTYDGLASYPTSTYSIPTDYYGNSSLPHYSFAHLAFIPSIAVTVAIGLFSCCLLCFFVSCCWSCVCSRPRPVSSRPHPYTSPYSNISASRRQSSWNNRPIPAVATRGSSSDVLGVRMAEVTRKSVRERDEEERRVGRRTADEARAKLGRTRLANEASDQRRKDEIRTQQVREVQRKAEEARDREAEVQRLIEEKQEEKRELERARINNQAAWRKRQEKERETKERREKESADMKRDGVSVEVGWMGPAKTNQLHLTLTEWSTRCDAVDDNAENMFDLGPKYPEGRSKGLRKDQDKEMARSTTLVKTVKAIYKSGTPNPSVEHMTDYGPLYTRPVFKIPGTKPVGSTESRSAVSKESRPPPRTNTPAAKEPKSGLPRGGPNFQVGVGGELIAGSSKTTEEAEDPVASVLDILRVLASSSRNT